MPTPVETRSDKSATQEAARQLEYLTRVFRLIWRASRGWTVAWGALLVVQGLIPVAFVYLTKPFVNGLQGAIGHGVSWETVRPVLLVAVGIGAALLLTELLKVLATWFGTAQSELVQDYIADLVHAKSSAVDIAFYETPDFYDHLYRARGDATNRPLAVLQSSGSLVQSAITLVAMAAVLVQYGAWLPPALLVATLPAFYVVVRTSRTYHEWWKTSTTERRRTQYFSAILTEPWHAGELRLLDLAGHFRTAYNELRRQLRTERLRILKDQSLAQLGAELLAILVTAATLAWMAYRAFLGRATLGDIALFYQAFQRGQGLMEALLTNAGQIYNNGLFLANLFEFLDLEPRVVERRDPVPAPATLVQGVRFRDVTFRYPGTERLALKHFNLSFPAGQTAAIVGVNGAGKTTLLKLLCRLYDPEAGKVELDGIDLRDLSFADLHRLVTVMFQMPATYQGTARENIAIGDLATTPDQRRIVAAARNSGADGVISALPQGYDTMLGKWFPGGTELSAGEWQRVALARAYLRQSQILILDEPTSFMDSWGEAAWFDRFRALARGRIGVIITHRLTIAMRADVIHVMQEGEVVESGNHHALLAQGGLYAQSWKSQTETAALAPQ